MPLLVYGQQQPMQDSAAQTKTQLEIVKASREFIERISAQSVADLEGQLAQLKAELAQCKAKPQTPEEAK